MGNRVYVEDDETPSLSILATDSDDGYKAWDLQWGQPTAVLESTNTDEILQPGC